MSGLQGVAGAGPGSEGQPGFAPAIPAKLALRILATTDIHAQLLSYDYYANRPQFGLGLAQTAALIADARARVPHSLLLDNGDFLQGSALADLGARPRRKRAHPAIAAFAALGYDAVSLGNHEFNYGLEGLESALEGALFPALSANVAVALGASPLKDSLLVAPYAMIHRTLPDAAGRLQKLTVGVLGLTPPEIMLWDRARLQGRLHVRPMVDAARAWVPEMRRAGADVVVCLAHTGIALNGPGHDECRAADLAAIDGLDVLVAGHTHQVFPPAPGTAFPVPDPRIDPEAGRVSGKPVVQPGHSGSHLGVVDLSLRPGPGGWRVAEAAVTCISASEVVAGFSPRRIRAVAAPLRAALASDHRAALVWTRQRIGQTPQALTSYFALVTDTPLVRLIAAAKVAHVGAELAGRPEAALPILSIARAYRTGGLGGPLNYTDIPAGPLSMRHVHDLYPFPNTIAASIATGAHLLARLEKTAALMQQLRPGVADQTLLDPDIPGFVFESIPGLTYQIDLGAPPGRRIRNLCHQTRPVRPDDRFVLVTNSHIAGREAEGAPIPLDGQTLVTQVIADHIRSQRAQPDTDPAPGWSFVPLPRGTSVAFDTGAGALAHLAEIAPLRPRLLGITPSGYHRFRLHL